MTVTDAVRDAWIHQPWWKRHIAKWLHFYPPFLYLFFLLWVTDVLGTGIGGLWKWVLVPFASWALWRIAVSYIGGAKWKSKWLNILKGAKE